MLTLLRHRAKVQFPLLAAIVAVVTIGATLLGVCALLLTVSQDRALEVGMARAKPADVEVTAYVSGIAGKNLRSVADDTRAQVARSLSPFTGPAVTRISSVTRPLGPNSSRSTPRVGYLSSIDGLAERARLTSGRWPQAGSSGPAETAVLVSTARLLNLVPGSRIRLGPEVGFGAEQPALTLVVVGVFQPRADSGWDRDPLKSTGYDPAYMDGRPHAVRAYGPFVVDQSDLIASGSSIDRLQVSTVPDLSAATDAALETVAGSLAKVNAELTGILGDRVKIQRVASDLPYTLGLAHAQQAVTRSAVLVVVLLGTVLTAVALALAGRLVTSLRSDETALLSKLGASRGQLAAVAAVEATLLAALAAVLAVPLSGLTHSGLTHLPALHDAGLAARPGVTGAQVSAIVIGALLLAGVLVVPVLRPEPELVVARGRLGLLARSGVDVVLLALAAVGWWQLRAQPTTETGADTVRVLAPVLFLLAGAAVAPRLLAPPLQAAERLARRSRGLVLPLAVFEAARRPRAIAAGLLLALAAATATFGVAFSSTWHRSQQDQADARVGTDLSVTLISPPEPGDGQAVAKATGGTISPVTDRGVIVGRWVGDAGEIPRVVAVDTRQAGALLRGRPATGTTWSKVGARLAPDSPVTGVALASADDRLPTLAGTATPGAPLQVVPRLVFQDQAGLRTPCTGPVITLDGRAHRLTGCSPPAEGLRVVAVSLEVNVDPAIPYDAPERAFKSQLTMDLTLPADPGSAAAASTPTWTASSGGIVPERLANPAIDVSTSAKGTLVRGTAVVDLAQLEPSGPAQLMATTFERPQAVPIALSERMATALAVTTGNPLTVTVGQTAVSAVVADVVPAVPSAPGESAMLADVDLLSRALIVNGDLEPAVDAWWVGQPRPGAETRAGALSLGRVDTRAGVSEQLSRGPLRVGLPAALTLLVPAALLLALAGTIMHVTSDVEARALEMARLRGLGLTRRHILGGLLAQHGAVLLLLLSAGAVVGALASWAVGPLLIRSDLGAAPVPGALESWPWSAETALLALLLIGGTAVVAAVVSVQLRRADAAHLRVGA